MPASPMVHLLFCQPFAYTTNAVSRVTYEQWLIDFANVFANMPFTRWKFCCPTLNFIFSSFGTITDGHDQLHLISYSWVSWYSSALLLSVFLVQICKVATVGSKELALHNSISFPEILSLIPLQSIGSEKDQSHPPFCNLLSTWHITYWCNHQV